MFGNSFAFSLCALPPTSSETLFMLLNFTTIIASYEARSRIQNKHGTGEMGIFLIHVTHENV